MSKIKFIEKLNLGERAKDYSYLILFFLTFSFFVLAVIRPNIATVFKLNKELENLIKVNESYDLVISQIISIQADLEATRDNIYVIDQALPQVPEISKLINDLKTTTNENQLRIDKLTISDISLKSNEAERKFDSVEINFQTAADFVYIEKFVKTTLGQRRLKTIRSLDIEGSAEMASQSAPLNAKFTIQGYYL